MLPIRERSTRTWRKEGEEVFDRRVGNRDMEVEKPGEWVKLELNVASFDESRFTSYVERCVRDEIAFSTIAVLGDTAQNRVALFELIRECSADIPNRGAFYTREEYARERIEVSTYNLRGVVIAMDGVQWIGVAAISDCREKGTCSAR